MPSEELSDYELDWIHGVIKAGELEQTMEHIEKIYKRIEKLETNNERLNRHYNLVTTFNDRIRSCRRRLNNIEKQLSSVAKEDSSDDFNKDGTLKEGTCINCKGCNRTEQSKRRKMIDDLTCDDWSNIKWSSTAIEEPKKDKYWGSCQQAIELAVKKLKKEFVEILTYIKEEFDEVTDRYLNERIAKYSEEEQDD